MKFKFYSLGCPEAAEAGMWAVCQCHETQRGEGINPLVPDAHYSERQDEPFSLQVQRLEVDFKLKCGFLFFAPWVLMG